MLPYVPIGHSLHVSAEIAPVSLEYLPAWQLSHAVLTPSVGLYLPASQLSQTMLTPASALYLPASQLSQVVLPSVAWCLPAGQSVQVSLSV